MPTDPEQQRLAVGKDAFTKAHRIHDFIRLLPDGVYPTTDILMLECNKHLLIMKSMKHGDDVTRAQERMWKAAVSYGQPEDAPGSITCLPIWGLGAHTRREWRTFDHMGAGPSRAGSVDDIRAVVSDWWLGNGGKRR